MAAPPVVCAAVRCSATAAVAGNVAVVVHVPLEETSAGAVPGTRAPPALRMLTDEPGTPVPLKATVRDGTVAPVAGPVTAKV